MTILAKKSFGIDDETGLEKEIHIWHISINGKEDTINIGYDIVLLSPKGKVVSVVSTNNYNRYNRPAIIEDGIEVKPANMKFDALKNSPVGQGILQMLSADIANIKSFDTLVQDITQD